jgi:hypothetical protein
MAESSEGTVSEQAAAVAHTVICMGLQREVYELQIERLKSTNRAMVIVSITAYILGMYAGYFVATSLHVG